MTIRKMSLQIQKVYIHTGKLQRFQPAISG